MAGAASLRTLRDKLEGIAFTFLQGRANADADINKLTRQIKELEALDLSKFEPTTNITKNKFLNGNGTTTTDTSSRHDKLDTKVKLIIYKVLLYNYML